MIHIESKKIAENETWVVSESISLSQLIIAEGASVTAPDSKALTLTVNNCAYDILPGTYSGDVVLTVSDKYKAQVMLGIGPVDVFYRPAILIKDNTIDEDVSVASAIKSGSFTSLEANDIVIDGKDCSLNGIAVVGDSEYTINRAKISLKGNGEDDFGGIGAAVMCRDNAKVTINDSELYINGISRGAISGNSHTQIHVNRTTIKAESVPFHEDMDPMWAIGLRGTNRPTNISDFSEAWYTDCSISTTGWGLMSVDGGTYNHLHLKNCTLEQTSDCGYGSIAISDNFDSYSVFDDLPEQQHCFHEYDNCKLKVNGYGVIMSLGTSGCAFTNGSVVDSKRYAALIFRNNGGRFRIADSIANTGSSTVVVKGANAFIELDNADLNPKNGVILQLMDNDDVGMQKHVFRVPVGQVDTPEAGRDLYNAVETEDVFINISNSRLCGDFYNSTTGLYPNLQDIRPEDNYVAPPLKGMAAMLASMPKPEGMDKPATPKFKVRGFGGKELQGPKNVDIRLISSEVTGIISSASQAYRDGVRFINEENREELSNITQAASPTINNGVIVHLDANSIWTVTGTSYITKLSLADGAGLRSTHGTLCMTVDGTEVPILPGEYTGKIVLSIR